MEKEIIIGPDKTSEESSEDLNKDPEEDLQTFTSEKKELETKSILDKNSKNEFT